MNVEQDPDRLESFAKFPLFHEKHRKNHRKVISKTSVGQKHNTVHYSCPFFEKVVQKINYK